MAAPLRSTAEIQALAASAASAAKRQYSRVDIRDAESEAILGILDAIRRQREQEILNWSAFAYRAGFRAAMRFACKQDKRARRECVREADIESKHTAASDISGAVRARLEQLGLQDALLGYLLDELDAAAAAKELGKAPKTVRNQATKARASLRQDRLLRELWRQLKDEFEGESL